MRVGHYTDFGLDTLSGALVAHVIEDCAQGVSNGLDRQFVFEELSPRAGGDDALGVGVLVGSLWKDQEGKAEARAPRVVVRHVSTELCMVASPCRLRRGDVRLEP